MPQAPPHPPASEWTGRENPLPRVLSAAEQYALGNELRRLGDHQSAEEALRAALEQDPALFDARLSLAFLYRDLGRIGEAGALFDPWLESNPDDAILLGRVAQLLDAIGDPGRALACYEQATRLDVDLAPAWFERGRLLLQSGSFEEAAQSLARALAINPEQGAAYLLLAQTRRFTTGDPLILFFENQLTQGKHPASTQACLHFALGKIRDDLGQPERAFAEIEAANAIRRKEVRFDRAPCAERLQRLLAVSPGFWIPPEPHPAQISPEPLFIVGLPRAGTTLLERLMATHPAIMTAGETDTLSHLLEALRLVERWQEPWDPDRTFSSSTLAEECFDAAAYYRTELTCGSRPGVRYLIDKNPLNFWHLGPIRRLFPHARILAVERDPRDVLLSLYFQNFDRPELGFSYAIDDIRFYLEMHQILMTHWQRCTGSLLRVIRYETLVQEPTTVVGELLDWLGLDPSLRDTVDRDQAVIRTASAWQARQPVYLRSVGRWKPYARVLIERYPELAQLGFGT